MCTYVKNKITMKRTLPSRTVEDAFPMGFYHEVNNICPSFH